MLAATPVQERSRGLQSGSPEGVVVVAVIVAALGCAVEPVEEDPPERLGGLVLG
jgi:hypothetical protein